MTNKDELDVYFKDTKRLDKSLCEDIINTAFGLKHGIYIGNKVLIKNDGWFYDDIGTVVGYGLGDCVRVIVEYTLNYKDGKIETHFPVNEVEVI